MAGASGEAGNMGGGRALALGLTLALAAGCANFFFCGPLGFRGLCPFFEVGQSCIRWSGLWHRKQCLKRFSSTCITLANLTCNPQSPLGASPRKSGRKSLPAPSPSSPGSSDSSSLMEPGLEPSPGEGADSAAIALKAVVFQNRGL